MPRLSAAAQHLYLTEPVRKCYLLQQIRGIRLFLKRLTRVKPAVELPDPAKQAASAAEERTLCETAATAAAEALLHVRTTNHYPETLGFTLLQPPMHIIHTQLGPSSQAVTCNVDVAACITSSPTASSRPGVQSQRGHCLMADPW